ncbi:hypothetical protein BDY24DRAFT_386700 [Mrakia frigida]|uniref:uncharacterized protein n=1 Tax=Mrakia frigida TaxID=29902 RepID=UPI003FCBF809
MRVGWYRRAEDEIEEPCRDLLCFPPSDDHLPVPFFPPYAPAQTTLLFSRFDTDHSFLSFDFTDQSSEQLACPSHLVATAAQTTPFSSSLSRGSPISFRASLSSIDSLERGAFVHDLLYSFIHSSSMNDTPLVVSHQPFVIGPLRCLLVETAACFVRS